MDNTIVEQFKFSDVLAELITDEDEEMEDAYIPELLNSQAWGMTTVFLLSYMVLGLRLCKRDRP